MSGRGLTLIYLLRSGHITKNRYYIQYERFCRPEISRIREECQYKSTVIGKSLLPFLYYSMLGAQFDFGLTEILERYRTSRIWI